MVLQAFRSDLKYTRLFVTTYISDFLSLLWVGHCGCIQGVVGDVENVVNVVSFKMFLVGHCGKPSVKRHSEGFWFES
jgi:hypothetical protein